MAESFITELNGVVTGKHHGDMDADLYGTPYYGHKKTAVPFEAAIVPLDLVEFYTQPDWVRKSDCRLIKEKLLPMPEGYVLEGDELRPMTPAERITAGLDEPPLGYKVDGGEIVPMTMSERVEAGQITREEYNQRMEAESQAELARRLAELQTPVCLARAEVDEGYAAERKAKLAALLAVEKQKGWPVEVKWPKE